MIRAIFDQPTEFEESIFYDVSGWTMPLAYDLDYAAMGRSYNADLLGEPASALPPVPAPDRASYGYVFRWTDYHSPAALYDVLDSDLLVRIATRPVEIETSRGAVAFSQGAVFVPLRRQEMDAEEIHARMVEIAEDTGVRIHAVSSGLTPTTGADLGGSRSFRPVQEPHALLLFDGGISRNDVGEVWHALDQRMGVRVTLRRKSQLGGLDWSRYTHLVLVGGNGALSESQTERVQQWIREEGGTPIAMRQSARWAQRTLLDMELPSDESENGETERLDYSDMSLRDAEHVIGGALFQTDLDTSHPLGWGLSDRELAVHRNTTFTLARPEGDPYVVVAEYEDEPLLAGYASQRRQDEIAGTPAILAQRQGRGAIILFADNPNFRATYLGTERVFLNAIFLSGLINRTSGDYVEE
jgi:hypothetical protein